MDISKPKIRDQFRTLLKKGMRNNKNKLKKNGDPSQTAIYYKGLYGFSVKHYSTSMKIGIAHTSAGGGIYKRLAGLRLCYPDSFLVDIIVINKPLPHLKAGGVARLLEDAVHSKLMKMKDSYSHEWKQVKNISNFRNVLAEVLNDHKDWWSVIITFGEHDNQGYWKIIKNENKDIKGNDLQRPSVSRKSNITNISDAGIV